MSKTKSIQSLKRQSTYPIGYVLCNFITAEKERKDFEGVKVKTNSHRYLCFANSGTTCVKCGLKGEYFALEQYIHDHNVGFDGDSYHFNLYAIKDGKEILMTKDHITARSKGGRNSIDNYQTMCYPCNEKKGNKL